MTIAASDQEEALRTTKLLERTISRLSEFKFPELEVIEAEEDDDDDDDYDDDNTWPQFKCPWCRHEDYIETYSMVSVTISTSPIAEPDDGDVTTFEIVYDDGDNQRTDVHLQCGRCEKPVSLPSGYDTEPY